jgi:AbrB family looped-hinge helix DNA binding protein
MEMEVTKITAKGQITVPVAIRRLLNLQTGDKVMFIIHDTGDEPVVRVVNASAMDITKDGNLSKRE